MAKQKNKSIIDETCVGLFETENSYETYILSSTVLSTIQRNNPHARLVHFRCFSEVLLALGYKEVLQKLSIDSLKSLIKKDNLSISDKDSSSKLTD